MAHEPDHLSEIRRINRIIGQLEGVKRMIEEKVYCPEILLQTKAVSSAIRSLQTKLLEGHINHCVKNSFESNSSSEDSEKKIKELIELFKVRIK